MTENKVEYGLKHVVVFDRNEEGGEVTFGSPIAMPGSVTLTLDPAGDPTEFYADNGLYYSRDNNQGYTGKWTAAMMPFAVSSIVLGDVLDANGVILESMNGGQPVAMAFEFDGDQKATRHILYNVTFKRPTQEGETASDKRDVKTKEFELTAALDPELGIAKARTGASTDAATYDSWYTTVYVPEMPEEV